LGVAERATLRRADWLSGVDGRFDLVLANPPYIAADEMEGLAPEVRLWEPKLALTPGGDGLDAYRVIARDAPARLVPNGCLIVEIGAGQAAAVLALWQGAGLGELAVLRDLAGRDRAVCGRKLPIA
jgi:release factor glutamine methyltransferase